MSDLFSVYHRISLLFQSLDWFDFWWTYSIIILFKKVEVMGSFLFFRCMYAHATSSCIDSVDKTFLQIRLKSRHLFLCCCSCVCIIHLCTSDCNFLLQASLKASPEFWSLFLNTSFCRSWYGIDFYFCRSFNRIKCVWIN